jgi:DNA-binding transcriptional regulator YiaG
MAEKIKVWRNGLGMSQEEFAEAIGVDESALAAWETGDHRPSRNSRHRLEKFFRDHQVLTP